ncbi:Cytidylate kinase [Rosistilla carotiformis]|uniref:Cytidylate kinase n=1 Tax=Rosistilla carotiformis TaxID=2528017 RepID=A0A518JQG6_9BACT|nr:(d)CMP kinase [Rosistilla carotiformis]QDV67782.1 Cytidylate kinase [Rosistilla carotiformis]
MVITIDGPAGAGKSSVARKLAQRLGFHFLDTGAMYRTVTHVAMQQGLDLQDVTAVESLAAALEIRLEHDRVWANGCDVSISIRTPEVTRNIRHVADIASVRQILNRKQRTLVVRNDYVTEGRDQGTEVFPDAICKIFLTASPEERARRRQRQLLANGQAIAIEQLLEEQNLRDDQDQNRDVGRLFAAEDAITVSTDGMDESQVVAHLESLVRTKLPSDG